jgi:ATP-dependent Clp protease ATP-binding subunit ClpB
LSEIGLSIKVNDDIINQIVENGYDPVYGARPIKRTILKMLENPLSQKILSGEFESGDTVLVNSKNDKVNFSSQKN